MTHQLSIHVSKWKANMFIAYRRICCILHTSDLFQTGVTSVTKLDKPFLFLMCLNNPASLSSTVSRLTWAHGWALRCEDYSQEPASLQTVHGVVWHQSQWRCFSRGAGRRQHGVRRGVHVLWILHFLGTSLPVDVKSGYTWIGSQNVPLELRESRWRKVFESQLDPFPFLSLLKWRLTCFFDILWLSHLGCMKSFNTLMCFDMYTQFLLHLWCSWVNFPHILML